MEGLLVWGAMHVALILNSSVCSDSSSFSVVYLWNEIIVNKLFALVSVYDHAHRCLHDHLTNRVAGNTNQSCNYERSS